MALHLLGRRSSVAHRCNSSVAPAPAPAGLRLRRGRVEDAEVISKAVWEEKMVPWGLDATNFVVAEDEQGKCLGFGQLQKKDERSYELRSIVVVDKKMRGKGIGQAVVKALVNDLRPDEEVWLTTPKNRMPFYERLGFTGDVVDGAVLRRIPSWLLVEAAFGVVIAPLVTGQPITVMRRGPPVKQQ